MRAFPAYTWSGAGMNVALATRIGLPIAAQARTVRLALRKRTRIIVARFRDAAEGTATGLRAVIDWGDGRSWTGKVRSRGGGSTTSAAPRLRRPRSLWPDRKR